MQMRTLLLACSLVFASAPSATAQFENLETIAPGSYQSFTAFDFPPQFGAFSAMPSTTGGLLVVGGAPLIPPSTGAQAMFGRGVDVQFRLLQPRNSFFARFRSLPYITTPPTTVSIRFFLLGFGWTPFMSFPINNTYSSVLVPVSGMFGQPFLAAQMVGNGSLPGYVGMDTCFLF